MESLFYTFITQDMHMQKYGSLLFKMLADMLWASLVRNDPFKVILQNKMGDK